MRILACLLRLRWLWVCGQRVSVVQAAPKEQRHIRSLHRHADVPRLHAAPVTSPFRFPTPLQYAGSGSGKSIKYPAPRPIKQRDPADPRAVTRSPSPTRPPAWRTAECRCGSHGLDRPARLLLRDSGSRSHPAAADELSDPDFHHVAASQLAVDGKLEQRMVRRRRGRLSRLGGSNSECPILSSSWPDWPSRGSTARLARSALRTSPATGGVKTGRSQPRGADWDAMTSPWCYGSTLFIVVAGFAPPTRKATSLASALGYSCESAS